MRTVWKVDDNAHADINRHFSWLCYVYTKKGINRHLFDGMAGAQPLRTKAFEYYKSFSESDKHLIEQFESVDKNSIVVIDDSQHHIVPQGPTRISRIILNSFSDIKSNHDEAERGEKFEIKSAVFIVSEYLTDPNIGGSDSYVQLTLRNYLFEKFSIYPSGLLGGSKNNEFSVTEFKKAFSTIWTSLRPRYNSTGQDPLPPNYSNFASAVLRHYLASKGLLWLRFSSYRRCLEYLGSNKIQKTKKPVISEFEFARPSYLETLPDLDQIINEIWGLPIPIRGANSIFSGGLRFSSRGGLVVGISGGAGTGKTSLALALASYLAPLDIHTLYINAEETKEDLYAKAESIVQDDTKRLNFFPSDATEFLTVAEFRLRNATQEGGNAFSELEHALTSLEKTLGEFKPAEEDFQIPKPCRALIVLDGVQDLIMDGISETGLEGSKRQTLIARLRQFIETCRKLKALVVLTSGDQWGGEGKLEYLVDIAMHLSHDSLGDMSRRPRRWVKLTKARHQLCSVGTHSFRISGTKGVRFSPQITSQLLARSIYATRLPNAASRTFPLLRTQHVDSLESVHAVGEPARNKPSKLVRCRPAGIEIFDGSNIFINGEGSGSKSALALKIALSPSYDKNNELIEVEKKPLIVSFLYPADYYEGIHKHLYSVNKYNNENERISSGGKLDVIHLFPGDYGADQLFNRIERSVRRAELMGAPYTSIIIDGIHNVYLQFPEIEAYKLLWPQLYSFLKSRPLTVISTHTNFRLMGSHTRTEYKIDDERSEPLRHALVQKTDFSLEVISTSSDLNDEPSLDKKFNGFSDSTDAFFVYVLSARLQKIPHDPLLWSRAKLVFFEADAQGLLKGI